MSPSVDSGNPEWRTDDALFEKWVGLLREAFTYAKGSHINRILLVPVDRFDSRGLDVYSQIWGELGFVQGLLPRELNELGIVTPSGLRSEAKQAALQEVQDRCREKPFMEVVKEARLQANQHRR